MKVLRIGSAITIVAMFLTISVCFAQDTLHATSEGFMQPKPVSGTLDALFWRTIAIAVIAGALGGVVYELLILQGNIEFPHKTEKGETVDSNIYAVAKYMYDLGIFARIIIGALAGIIILLIFSPDTILGLLATSLAAGSAGIAVFSSIQDRLLAALSKKDAADVRTNASLGREKLSEAITAYEAFKKSILAKSSSPIGANKLNFGSETSLNQDDFTKMERLLSESKGALDAILEEKR